MVPESAVQQDHHHHRPTEAEALGAGAVICFLFNNPSRWSPYILKAENHCPNITNQRQHNKTKCFAIVYKKMRIQFGVIFLEKFVIKMLKIIIS